MNILGNIRNAAHGTHYTFDAQGNAIDPSQFQGFDYEPLRRSMEQSLRLQRARGDQGILRQNASANPYGGSSQLGRQIGESGADLTGNINNMNAGLDRQDYNERLGLMNNFNNNWQAQVKDYQQKAKDAQQKQEDDLHRVFDPGKFF